MPRAGIGALGIPPLLVLDHLGLLPGAGAQIASAVDQLKRRRDSLLLPGSIAATLARRIGRTMPIIYAGGTLGAVAAARWKGQVNENAKVPAFANVLPEMCHNEVCGWGQHGDVTRQVFTQVLLRHDFEHPGITRRFDLIEPLVDEVVSATVTVRAEGDGPLAQLLDLVLLGDVTSLELAAQEGLDPGPVPVLDQIKQALVDG
jgi:glucose/mannose-6-phosphate isomerase